MLLDIIHAGPGDHVVAVFIQPEIIPLLQVPHGEQEMFTGERHDGFKFQ
jgi:hypothetical protein